MKLHPLQSGYQCSKRDAEQAAHDALKLMNGKGWKVRIWENLGWHYCIYRGDGEISIYPININSRKGNSVAGVKFHAMIAQPGSLFSESIYHKDPNIAANSAIAKFRNYVKGQLRYALRITGMDAAELLNADKDELLRSDS
jgi:ABC-type phosphate transport system ATPase subunit